MFHRLSGLLVASLLISAPARAQLAGYEGIDYSTGSALNGLNGGTGWSGAWSTSSSMVVASGSLVPQSPADTIVTSGNRLSLPTTNPYTTASRTFGTDLRSVSGDSSVWISFVISRTAGNTSGSYGGLVIGNEAGGNAAEGRLFIGDSGALTDTWALERAGGGAASFSNISVASNPTVQLVVKIQFATGADTVLLYVNRTPGGSNPVSNDAALTSFDLNPSGNIVTDFGLWYGGDGGYEIDEIRIGSSFADVTPVPEPTLAFALAMLAMMGFGTVRRIIHR